MVKRMAAVAVIGPISVGLAVGLARGQRENQGRELLIKPAA